MRLRPISASFDGLGKRDHKSNEVNDGLHIAQMVAVLKSLNSLSESATEIFEGLLGTANNITERIRRVQTRSEVVSMKLASFEQNMMRTPRKVVNNSAILSWSNKFQFKMGIFTPATRNESLKRLYADAQPMPQLHLMNKFSSKVVQREGRPVREGTSCSGYYSDPKIFERWWIQQQQNAISEKRLRKRAEKAKRRATDAKLGLSNIDTSRKPRQSMGHKPTMGANNVNITRQQIPRNSQHTIQQPASPPTAPRPNQRYGHESSPAPPVPRRPGSPSPLTASPSSPPPPPPGGPLSPPSPSGYGSPPPPPPGMHSPPAPYGHSGYPLEQSGYAPPPPLHEEYIPPPPQMAVPPPVPDIAPPPVPDIAPPDLAGLPPPPVMSASASPALVIKKGKARGGVGGILDGIQNAKLKKSAGPVEKKKTGRDAFLEQIRRKKDIKLRKVNRAEIEAAKPPPAGGGVVKKLMELRAQIEGDSDDEDDDDDDDW